MKRRRVIAVIGGGDDPPADVLEAAEEVGRLLAARDCALITGGRGGVMEAASRGCRKAGGLVVGILPSESPDDANSFVEVALPTGLGEARNAVIATAAEALIAVGGEYGTLSEIAHGLRLGKRVVVLRSQWSSITGTVKAVSAEEAVEIALGNCPET